MIGVGTTVAGVTVFFGWQTTVLIWFFALAFVLLLNNLQELARDRRRARPPQLRMDAELSTCAAERYTCAASLGVIPVGA